MLNNRAYIGEAMHKGESYPGEHDAIIDLEMWDRVHSILQESPRKRAARTRAETPALLANGIVEPTNTELPNYEQLIGPAKFAGGYGVSALQFGIAYNPSFVNPAPTSWLDLLDPAYAGYIALPSMPNSGGYALLSMLARIAGGSEADLTVAIDQIAAFKDQAHSFIGPTPQVEEQIKSGEIRMYLDIGGVAVRAKAERGVPVEFIVPDEGAPLSINSLVIPTGSKHKGCAQAFVAFLLGPESQTGWAETLLYGSTSSIIELESELVSRLYPTPGSTSIVDIDWSVIAGGTADTLDYWNRQVTS
jgi:ABC-type Fe3+ transport system substrate-binding protein